MNKFIPIFIAAHVCLVFIWACSVFDVKYSIVCIPLSIIIAHLIVVYFMAEKAKFWHLFRHTLFITLILPILLIAPACLLMLFRVNSLLAAISTIIFVVSILAWCAVKKKYLLFSLIWFSQSATFISVGFYVLVSSINYPSECEITGVYNKESMCIDLSWTKVDNATEYWLVKNEKETIVVDGFAKTDCNVKPGSHYFYKIIAKRNKRIEAECSTGGIYIPRED